MIPHPYAAFALVSYVFVMAPGIIIAAIFTMLYGRMVDRHGFLRAVLLPPVLFLVGCAMRRAKTKGGVDAV